MSKPKDGRYGCWGGFPRGHAEDKTKCVEEVCSQARGSLPHQCNRKRGWGPEGEYCSQHAKQFLSREVSPNALKRIQVSQQTFNFTRGEQLSKDEIYNIQGLAGGDWWENVGNDDLAEEVIIQETISITVVIKREGRNEQK